VLAFGLPFPLVVLADLQRDLHFALYVASVFMFVGLWAGQTQQRSRESCWCSRVLGEPWTPHHTG
jgi:hypothetical protein